MLVGYLPQGPDDLNPAKTVLETYRCSQTGYEGEFIGRLVGYGLFRLKDMQKRVEQLCLGQQRRLEIARLMAQTPNILSQPTISAWTCWKPSRLLFSLSPARCWPSRVIAGSFGASAERSGN